jgi:hypothetical protein
MPSEHGRLNRRRVLNFFDQIGAVVLHISYGFADRPAFHFLCWKRLKKLLPIVAQRQPAKTITAINNGWHAVMNRFKQFVGSDGADREAFDGYAIRSAPSVPQPAEGKRATVVHSDGERPLLLWPNLLQCR